MSRDVLFVFRTERSNALLRCAFTCARYFCREYVLMWVYAHRYNIYIYCTEYNMLLRPRLRKRSERQKKKNLNALSKHAKNEKHPHDVNRFDETRSVKRDRIAVQIRLTK